jgi:uncharacterized protein involved in exopolysaccharide biosynthesis
MGLRRYFDVVGAHRRTLLAVIVGSALVGQIVSYAIPSRYDAVATIQVTPDRPDQRATGVAVDASEAQGQLIVEMVRGRDVASILVDQLALDARTAPAGLDALQDAISSRATELWAFASHGFIAPAGSSAVERVSNALDATALQGGRIVRITASAPSAELAAKMANVAVQAVITVSRNATSASATTQVPFLETQTALAKKQAEAARLQLLDYATRSDAIQSASVLAAGVDLDRARVAARQNEIDLSDARQRLAEVEADLRVTPQQTTSTTTSSSSTSSISSVNPVYVALRDQANARRQDVAGFEARATKLDADVQAREAQFRAFLAHDSQLSSLNQELKLANDTYSRLSAELALARIEAARPISEVREIGRAIAPTYPAFPIRIQFAALFALAGLLVAMVTLFLRHNADSALRSPAEAEAALADLRLLAVVPKQGGTRMVGRR